MADEKPPVFADISAAAKRIEDRAVRTPLLECSALNEHASATVFIKPECLQRTGSFKFRGAYNTLSQMSETERQAGVIACSSGNHAQGVAMAAELFACPATIVMPSDAPRIKVERTRRSGADIIFYDRETEDRDQVTAEVIDEKGGTLVHPFNHPHVIAGQGTVGLEIAEDLNNMDQEPDRVLVCTGGGGLTAGVALAIHQHYPTAKIHSVEPAGFDDYRRSLQSNSIEKNDQQTGSICDAVITPSPGSLGFEINAKILSEGLVVTDQDALKAVRFAFEELKLVVEPGGAVALAALLNAGQRWAGEVIVVIISGGNVDQEMFLRALNS